MKAIDKTIRKLIVGCVLACCLPLFIPHAFAVDNLQISVQATNVILTWPSIEGEVYVVQYRRTLNAADMWRVLAYVLPAATNASFTSYTNVGVVQYPPAAAARMIRAIPRHPRRWSN